MHSISLDGKAAIVTGAGSGIGRAIATMLAAHGAALACLDLDGAAAEATAQAIAADGGRALALQCDVSAEADTQRAVHAARDAFGLIHVLVNAAATDDPSGTVLELDPAAWERVFAVNVTGAYLMSRAVLPLMVEAGGGSIIHIASQLGRVGAPGRPAYCAHRRARSSNWRGQWPSITPGRTSGSTPFRPARSKRDAWCCATATWSRRGASPGRSIC